MKNALRYLIVLFRQHWLSFLFACVIPTVVGVAMIAIATDLTFINFNNYLKQDEYLSIGATVSCPDMPDSPDIASNDGAYVYYLPDTKYGAQIEQYPIIGRELKCKIGDINCSVYDYDGWRYFPEYVCMGRGFGGNADEAIVDISLHKEYKIGKTYSFELTGGSRGRENLGTVEAKVVGYMRNGSGRTFYALCLANGISEMAPKHPSYTTLYRRITDDQMKEIKNHWYTFGYVARNTPETPDAINKRVMLMVGFVMLALLGILGDLCVNTSILKRTEKVSMRLGLRLRDISIAYALKAGIQVVVSFIFMLVITLLFNFTWSSPLIIEVVWAGLAAAAVLSFISWGLDALRLYGTDSRPEVKKAGAKLCTE